MSNRNNNNNDNFSHPEESRKLWPFFFIIPILGFSFLPIAGSFAPCSAPPCPIVFDNLQTSGNAGTGLFASTMQLVITIPTAGDMMIVAVGANGNLNAISLTDTQSNTFAHSLTGVNGVIGATIDAFTTLASGTGSDTLTVTFADGGPPDAVINVGFYKNVVAIGRVVTLASTNIGTSLTMPFNTTKSGSLVLGFTELNPASNPGILASPGFIQRTDQPTTTGSTQELDFEEANQTYSANTVIQFAPSWPTLGAQQSELGALELLPSFAFPFDLSLCPRAGNTCHANFATKATGGTVSNQALTANTIYCTGITTNPLTTTITSAISIYGDYSLESRTVAGQVFTVQFVISNTAPTTTFGLNICAGAVNGGSTSVNLYTPTISTAGIGFSQSASLTTPNLPAGTYWGSINIRPVATGVSIDSLGTGGTASVPGSSLAIYQSA